MEFLILGIVVAINFIIIKMKLTKKRWEDAIFDILILCIIMLLFSGSYAGLVVGSVASLFISLYFYASPPKFFTGENGFLKEFIKRAKKSSHYDKD